MESAKQHGKGTSATDAPATSLKRKAQDALISENARKKTAVGRKGITVEMSLTLEACPLGVLSGPCDRLVKATVLENWYSASVVTRNVLKQVLKHNKFIITDSRVRGACYVALEDKEDVIKLDHNGFGWGPHIVTFKKIGWVNYEHPDIAYLEKVTQLSPMPFSDEENFSDEEDCSDDNE